jgi:hypothetical protein
MEGDLREKGRGGGKDVKGKKIMKQETGKEKMMMK